MTRLITYETMTEFFQRAVSLLLVRHGALELGNSHAQSLNAVVGLIHIVATAATRAGSKILVDCDRPIGNHGLVYSL